MWSQSSSPHEQGLIQFEFASEGLMIAWHPDTKQLIPWNELAWMSGQPNPNLKTEADFLKEQAQSEGYELGMARALTEARSISILTATAGNPFVKKYVDELEAAIRSIEGNKSTALQKSSQTSYSDPSSSQ